MSNGIAITGGNFESEVLNSPIPVLLDFWASWCGPCKMLAPYIDQIATEYAGQIKVGAINVDEEDDLVTQHGIASVPMLVVYKDGAVAAQKAGNVPKHDIEALFKPLI